MCSAWSVTSLAARSVTLLLTMLLSSALLFGRSDNASSTGNYNSKETCNDQSYNGIADSLPTAEPNLVVDTESLHCAPETVCKVEPQSSKPDNIESYIYRACKSFDNVTCTIGNTCHYTRFNISAHHVKNLRQLHVCPEIDKMEAKTKNYNDTEDKHVLRSPRNSLWSLGNSIALITASLSVLHCENESIDEVKHYKNCKTCCSNQCIPISSQELTDSVVTFGADYSNQVH